MHTYLDVALVEWPAAGGNKVHTSPARAHSGQSGGGSRRPAHYARARATCQVYQLRRREGRALAFARTVALSERPSKREPWIHRVAVPEPRLSEAAVRFSATGLPVTSPRMGTTLERCAEGWSLRGVS